jgi:4-hydroxy-tetrahydrodipicolinate synthase
VNPAAIVDLYRNWQSADADARQQALDNIRAVFARFPMIPALKSAIGIYSHDGDWGTVRPPLVALNSEQRATLEEALTQAGFAMPGIEAALA